MKHRSALIIALATVMVITNAGPAAAIIGGERVSYPWAVAFAVREPATAPLANRVYCSGVLIKPTWVLTAAHCNHRAADHVIIGRAHVSNAGGAVRQVSHVWKMWDNTIYCPSRASRMCDIALVLLNEPVSNTDLDLANEPVLSQWGVGTAARVYGYGKESVDAGFAGGFLDRASTRITEFRANHYTMIARSDPGQAVCYGDSGGPLVVSTSTGPRVVGIVYSGIGNPGDCWPGGQTEYIKVGWRGSSANSQPFRWVTAIA